MGKNRELGHRTVVGELGGTRSARKKGCTKSASLEKDKDLELKEGDNVWASENKKVNTKGRTGIMVSALRCC